MVSFWIVIAIVCVIGIAAIVFVIDAILRAHRRRVSTGKEGMVGQVAVVKTRLAPSGTVFIEGALWNATSEDESIESGEEVIVTKVDRLKLNVVRKSK